MPPDSDTAWASDRRAAGDVYSHYRTCNLCEAMCGLEIKMRGQAIVSIQGDEADVFSHGHICPKAVALRDIYADPDRLKFPLRRTATGWEQIGWEEALDEVATKLRAVQAPHGIDLGPLRPCLPERLMTPSRRIELAPEIFLKDVARLERTLLGATASDGKYDLSLIGRRQLRSNNSWMHNSPRLVRGPERCTLLMHPRDAAARGLGPDHTVCVRSRVGEIELPLEISDQVMPGVVSIPHGWGHSRPGIRLATARQHAGASLNDLSDEQLLDELTGNAAFSGVPVSVQAL
jgi:anaerobic selenocysteine-containing dehydrogenase